MNILTPNRGRIGQAVSNTFDKVLSAISSVWLVEHNDDGTHADVTAESLAVSGDTALTGDLTVGGFVESLDFGDADGSVVVEGDSVTDEYDMSEYPTISSTADLVTPVLESSKPFVPSADGTLSLGFLTGATAGRRWESAYFSKHVNAKTVNAFNGLYDFDRDKYLGQWTTFTPTRTASAGTWTAGTVVTAAYMLIGKTMWVSFDITGTTVSNAGVDLRIAIPGGFTAAKEEYVPIHANDNAAGTAIGTCLIQAAATILRFYSTPALVGFAIATTATDVRCVVPFEVQ